MKTEILNGARLTALREAQGLTLLDLARAVEVSDSYIGKLEAGTRQPSAKVAKRLVAVLRANRSDLLTPKAA